MNLSAKIFDRLDEEGINVDMISQSPLTGSYVSISFSTSSEDMVKVAALANEISREYPSVRPLISHNNVKISLYGEEMPRYHGIAGQCLPGAEKLRDGCAADYHLFGGHFGTGQWCQRRTVCGCIDRKAFEL